MPFDEAWEIALQIAAGLEYTHEKGIVHRDLKPANVKITPDGKKLVNGARVNADPYQGFTLDQLAAACVYWGVNLDVETRVKPDR